MQQTARSTQRPPSRRTRVFLVGLDLSLTAATVLGQTQAHGGVARLVADIVIGVAGCVLLSGVFRWPVAGIPALPVLAALPPAATPSATGATIVIAARNRPAVVAVAAVAGVTGHAIYGLWQPPYGLSFGWWLVLDLAVHAALIGWGLLIRARAELIDSLCERAVRAEAEQGRRVAEARAAERRALAREMHDVLAHRLSLVATFAGALEYREDATAAQITRAAGVIREGVHQALAELREVIGVLREDTESDRPQPGLAELPDLVAGSRASEVVVHFDDRISDKESVPAAVGRTGYRVVQEGLTNARKHAAGLPVHVSVGGGPGADLRIEVRNPIGGIPSEAPGTGTGLIGLTERVRLTGGRLDHEFTSSGEFRLCASIPWPL